MGSRNSVGVLVLGWALVASACSTGSTGLVSGPRAELRAEAPAGLPSLRGTAFEEAVRIPLPTVLPENHETLRNVFHLGTRIVSGSEPHGEDAFRVLAGKQIRTIITVDGKVPDKAMAAKFGMRYVHIPIQYSGISQAEIAQLAKTFREQPGPFFVHCFHGRHRGPAAAAIGRLVLDGVAREKAIAEMRQWCGTSKTYEGLYRTIAMATIPSAEQTAALDFEFPAAHPMGGVAGSMVPIVRARDHLRELRKRAWRTDEAHPDVDALNEADKLLTLFEQLRMVDSSEYDDDYRGWIEDSVRQTRGLRDALREQRAGRAKSGVESEEKLEHIGRHFDALLQTCNACHDEYRN